jgi:hypothetical protein
MQQKLQNLGLEELQNKTLAQIRAIDPELLYALLYWGGHLRRATTKENVSEALGEFLNTLAPGLDCSPHSSSEPKPVRVQGSTAIFSINQDNIASSKYYNQPVHKWWIIYSALRYSIAPDSLPEKDFYRATTPIHAMMHMGLYHLLNTMHNSKDWAKYCADLGASDCYGWLPMAWAFREQHAMTVRFCLKHMGPSGGFLQITAFWLACSSSYEVMTEVTSTFPTPPTASPAQWRDDCLLSAVSNGDIRVLDAAIEYLNKAGPNASPDSSLLTLRFCVLSGRADLLGRLLAITQWDSRDAASNKEWAWDIVKFAIESYEPKALETLLSSTEVSRALRNDSRPLECTRYHNCPDMIEMIEMIVKQNVNQDVL